MSCFERPCRVAVAAAVLLAAGCGFRPLYAPDTSIGELAAISVAPIQDRSGQVLRAELTDLLDPARSGSTPRYRLDVRLSEERERLSLERSGFASRINLRIEAAFTLVDPATGATVAEGTSRAISSFNVLDNTSEAPRDASKFSTFTAEQGARARVLRQLAQDIRRRLAVHFAGAAQPATPAVPG
jgi:LPS-assembly lipoprotein